jgi:hypothetical protein
MCDGEINHLHFQLLRRYHGFSIVAQFPSPFDGLPPLGHVSAEDVASVNEGIVGGPS